MSVPYIPRTSPSHHLRWTYFQPHSSPLIHTAVHLLSEPVKSLVRDALLPLALNVKECLPPVVSPFQVTEVHEPGINLNSPNLEQIKAELRRDFSRSILSDGTIKEIIRKRRHGPFQSLSQLLDVNGVSAGTFRALYSRLEPILGNLSYPVWMLLGGHGDTDDAMWIQRTYAGLEKGIEPMRPLTVWLELGSAPGMPDTIEDLTACAEHGGIQVPWAKELSKDHVLPRLVELITRQYERMRKINRPTVWGSDDGFSTGIRDLITQIKSSGRALEVNVEWAPSEAYIYALRFRATIFHYAPGLLLKGKAQAAYEAVLRGRSYFHEEQRLRDAALAQWIARAIESNPERLHAVVRGGAHAWNMTRELRGKGIFSLNMAVPMDPRQKFEDVVSNPQECLEDTPHRHRAILELLFEIGNSEFAPLYREFLMEKYQREVPDLHISNFTHQLPLKLLEDWFQEVASQGAASFEDMGKETWFWMWEQLAQPLYREWWDNLPDIGHGVPEIVPPSH